MNLFKLRTIFVEKDDLVGFKLVLAFLHEPTFQRLEQICLSKNCEFYKDDIMSLGNTIINLKKNDVEKYRVIYRLKQYSIWESFYYCIRTLHANEEKLKTIDINIYKNNYNKSCEAVIRVCEIFSESQYAVTKLEDNIGVDRFLDRIVYDDMKSIADKLDNQFMIANKLLASYKLFFKEKWNLTNISKLISHKLISYDENSYICSNYSTNNENVIFLLIDGFGLTQYLWNKKLNADEENLSLNDNIFSYLSRNRLMKESVLGASYVTDTGAGIAQIMLGQDATKTGLISSLVETTDRKFQNNKNVDNNTFYEEFNIPDDTIFKNCQKNQITSTTFYCSNFDYRNLSSYTIETFKPSKLEKVVPYERVFQKMLREIKTFKNNNNKNLIVSYITAIDHSGHTMGAFSKFEKYEHYKINSLFKNFMIELVLATPYLFNGKNSILISADHGITESSNRMISWKDINYEFKKKKIYSSIFLENNRALFIYGLHDINLAYSILKDYFENLNIKVDILTELDPNYSHFFYCGNHSSTKEIMPQIVVSLISKGLFFSRTVDEELKHYGGHGGNSICESFVPLLEITLDKKLKSFLENHFINALI